MRIVRYLKSADDDLQTYRADASRIEAKIKYFAETGAGDIIKMVNSDFHRLRIGKYRALIRLTETEVIVNNIGVRGGIYG